MNQWYATNTTIKYPLDPFHEGPVPDDMLLDMAVSVPEGIDVYLTNLIVTERYVFLSLEATDESAVGHVIQTFPSVSSVVQLDMAADGYGWVVFGPGVLEYPREYKDIRIRLADSVLLPGITTVDPFDLYVDGIEYPRPEILNIRPLDYMASEETDALLRLVRADDQLSGDMSITLFTSEEYSSSVLNFINGVGPDAAGNIVLAITHNIGSGTITEIKRTSDDTIIGLLLKTTDITDCLDETDRLKNLLLCRTEYGITYQLPLDPVNCDISEICPQYNVTYDGNGATSGTPPLDLTNYQPNDLVTVLGNTGSLARIGFGFNGWNTQTDGLGTHYTPAATFNITENLLLYAEWV